MEVDGSGWKWEVLVTVTETSPDRSKVPESGYMVDQRPSGKANSGTAWSTQNPTPQTPSPALLRLAKNCSGGRKIGSAWCKSHEDCVLIFWLVVSTISTLQISVSPDQRLTISQVWMDTLLGSDGPHFSGWSPGARLVWKI